MQPFYALIVPQAPGQPPGIWGPNPGFPTPPIANVPGIPNPNPPGWGAHPEHPIYYPPSIWGPNDPRPGYGLPGQPPGFWGPNDPRPTPPIHIPPNLGIWGGGNVPMPSPPIANVPGAPGYRPPVVIDPPPGNGEHPENPINRPPAEEPEGYDWKLLYAPSYEGWVWVLVPEAERK